MNNMTKENEPWSMSDRFTLRSMAKRGYSTEEIAIALERSESSIRNMAHQLGESLMPKD